MPYAVINVLDRQRARNQSERVTTQADDHLEEEDEVIPDLERGAVSHTNEEEDVEDDNNEADHNHDNQNGTQVENTESSTVPVFTRHRMTLAELEEERELFRRRSSLCILFSIFFLIRLWIEAITEQDMGLLILCIVGTSWTARWVNHNREREEELDRMIANYNNEQQNNRNEPIDMSMLSFQAQLALAIMESQRQMMQGGGYGHSSDGQSPGVSDAAKEKWSRFAYTTDPKAAASSGAYGSVKTLDDDDDNNSEEPHCSICLCEYEGGDACVKLPCHHIYHEECISSWTMNHTKCPLCNLELETCAARRSEDESAAASSGIPVIV